MTTTTETTNNGRVHLIGNVLTDNSIVWDIHIENVGPASPADVCISCCDKNAADALFVLLSDANRFLID